MKASKRRVMWPYLALCALALACGGATRESKPAAEGDGAHTAASTAPATESQPRSAEAEETIPLSPIPVGPADASSGSPLAPVTIVAFLDLQCPFSARSQATLRELEKAYGSKLRIVFKHHPLPFHAQAKPAALMAQVVFQTAGDQAFRRFLDRVFADRQRLTDENLLHWAQDLGVSASAFTPENNAVAAEKVEDDIELARRIGATGTPAFFINGRRLPGAQPKEKFAVLIDEELAVASTALEGGLAARDVYAVRSAANYLEPVAELQRDPSPPDLTVWKIPVAKDDPWRGGKEPLVTIVEIGDFQCPFTKRVEPTLQALLEHYGDDLRLVWKDGPLPFHAQGRPAAALGRAAYAKGGNVLFWKAHEALFAVPGAFDAAGLATVASDLQLSAGQYERELASKKFESKLAGTADLAADFNARGTPAFFINGVRLSGARPVEDFQQLIDQEMEKARGLLAKGVPRAVLYAEIMKGAEGPPPPAKKALVGTVPQPAPARGPASAAVTIIQFADFECPFCARANATLSELLKKYPKQVRIEWHNLPLPFHSHAALAAEAAHEVFLQQGSQGFFRYHDQLFANREDLTRDTLLRLAAQQGIDMNRLNKALDERTHRARIDADRELASQTGITGTPGFIVGGEYFVSGAQPLRMFERAVESALADSKR